jgi:hypothetical protein
MKKVILMFALAGFMTAGLVSCKGGEDNSGGGNDTTKTEAAPQPEPQETPAPETDAENTNAEAENTEAENKGE